jgi:ABC-type branched-subunit amino acid transport system substrate-binding protein
VTAILIVVNHLYPLGTKTLALGAVLVVMPTALLWWFRNTRSRVAFAGYLLMNLWIVVGFGLIKGLWESVLPVFLGTLLSAVSASFPRPTLGPVPLELSGILTFIGSLFVLFYAYRLVRAYHDAPAVTHAVPLAGGALLAAAIIGAYVFAGRDRWTPLVNGVVRIGVVVPTEGPYTILGNSFVKAVQMARDDLRGTRYRYELVMVDVGQDPDQARAAIQRAIREQRVNAIVGGISLFGQVTKPLATAARIPHTCVCTVTSIGDGAYNFTNIPSPEAEAVLWVQEARRRDIRRVALLTQDYPSIHNHVTALKAEAVRAGLAIVYERAFPDSVTDFRALIGEARGASPDVYYVEALNPQLDMLGQQLADARIRNIASVVAPSLSRQPDLFEGTWYTDSNLREVVFKARFETKYPGTQFATHMMPYAYDDFNMIVQAFERGENPAVYIRKIAVYDGTAGTLTKPSRSGTFQSTPAVWLIRNGRPALASNHSTEGSQ